MKKIISVSQYAAIVLLLVALGLLLTIPTKLIYRIYTDPVPKSGIVTQRWTHVGGGSLFHYIRIDSAGYDNVTEVGDREYLNIYLGQKYTINE